MRHEVEALAVRVVPLLTSRSRLIAQLLLGPTNEHGRSLLGIVELVALVFSIKVLVVARLDVILVTRPRKTAPTGFPNHLCALLCGSSGWGRGGSGGVVLATSWVVALWSWVVLAKSRVGEVREG